MSTADPRGNARELTLATTAFAICFYAWALLGPLGPDLQDQLGLSDGQARADRIDPGRARLAHADPTRRAHRPPRWTPGVHRADGVHAAAARRPGALQRLLGRGAGLRLPARVRRGLVRGRGAVREQVVPGGPSGLRARDLRNRHGRHGARSAHRASDCRCDQPRRSVLDRRRRGRRDGHRLLGAGRGRSGIGAGQPSSMFAALSAFRGRAARAPGL